MNDLKAVRYLLEPEEFPTIQRLVGLEAVAEVRVELVERAVTEEVLPLEFTLMLMAPMEVWLIVSFKQET